MSICQTFGGNSSPPLGTSSVGAAAIFKEFQPEMLTYSIAKTGVHSLTLNLSQSKVLPDDTIVVIILL
jgi:hypothetical protein